LQRRRNSVDFYSRMCYMKEYAHIRARGERPSLSDRRPVGVGSQARSLGRSPSSAGSGDATIACRSGGDPHHRHPRGRRCGSVGLGGRATGSGGAHRSGLRRVGREGWPVGGRVGTRGRDPAGPKCDLAAFLDTSVARLSCLPASAFSGQAFHRVAQQVSERALEQAQVAIAKAAVARFELSTDVLAFDSTNFDTHIATTTPGVLARRGHAKSKRADLRVVGLGLLVSETGHVPLLYRSYGGNGSDQALLGGPA